MCQRGTGRISAPTAPQSPRHTTSSSFSIYEGRGLAPLAREDKGFQGLADPRGHLPRPVRVESGHLVDEEAEGHPLNDEVLDCQTDVVKGVPIRFLVSLKGRP